MSALSRLQDQRDALDALILAVRHAESVGINVGAFLEPSAAPTGTVAALLSGPLTTDVVTPKPARAPRTRREQRAVGPEPATTPGDEPLLLGAYDAKILACVKLAPPLGLSTKEVVKGVAGKKAEDQAVYQTVWSALQKLAARGLIRKEGRYYLPPEPAES